jgi:hypothetical protein
MVGSASSPAGREVYTWRLKRGGRYAFSQTSCSHCNHPLLCPCLRQGQEKSNSSGGCSQSQDGPRGCRSIRRCRREGPERQPHRSRGCREGLGSVGAVHASAGRIYSRFGHGGAQGQWQIGAIHDRRCSDQWNSTRKRWYHHLCFRNIGSCRYSLGWKPQRSIKCRDSSFHSRTAIGSRPSAGHVRCLSGKHEPQRVPARSPAGMALFSKGRPRLAFSSSG